ncbi:DUF4417 domain-containing protein [Ruminiclostridium cellobioparum]|uniref:DUF4417 domain-containing protein n=1 Tax=Ruminiclostridium cellobioparum TaxID=29355 RepID=UPI0028AD4906|nr:DUF4417 domain-containing protein [Ruminiclostridium cellobioparum]
MCDAPFVCNNRCVNCIYTCRQRPGAALYYKKIRQTELELMPNDLYEAPIYIPTLPSPLHIQYNDNDITMIAVHGGKYMSPSGKKISNRFAVKGVHSTLNLNRATNIILHFYVQDRTLEGFWNGRKEIYDKIKNENFKFIIAPNFSVYEDSPRIEHMINIRRSIIVYNELRKNGINAVPDVSWYEIKDLQKWVDLINRSGIKLFAFSFQTVGLLKRSTNAWKGYMLGLKYLCERISEDVGVIIVGLSGRGRIKEIMKIIDKRKVSIINTYAYMRAKTGRTYHSADLEYLKTHDELIIQNIKEMNIRYNMIKTKMSIEGE